MTEQEAITQSWLTSYISRYLYILFMCVTVALYAADLQHWEGSGQPLRYTVQTHQHTPAVVCAWGEKSYDNIANHAKHVWDPLYSLLTCVYFRITTAALYFTRGHAIYCVSGSQKKDHHAQNVYIRKLNGSFPKWLRIIQVLFQLTLMVTNGNSISFWSYTWLGGILHHVQ